MKMAEPFGLQQEEAKSIQQSHQLLQLPNIGKIYNNHQTRQAVWDTLNIQANLSK